MESMDKKINELLPNLTLGVEIDPRADGTVGWKATLVGEDPEYITWDSTLRGVANTNLEALRDACRAILSDGSIGQ